MRETGTPRNAGDDPVRVRRRRLKIVPKSIEEGSVALLRSEVNRVCSLCSAKTLITISRTYNSRAPAGLSHSLFPPRSSLSIAFSRASRLISPRESNNRPGECVAPSVLLAGFSDCQECDSARRPRERQVSRVRGFSCQEATGVSDRLNGAAMGVVNRGVVSR